ncbi:hypothetical protein [Xanthomonas cerealis]|uniref:hypothetical protein n=1 Tax=Xanthomonas cerealis TaxID=3390025 RepID=UPI0039647523
MAPAPCWVLRRDKTHIVHALRHDAACAHLREDPQAVGASSACIPLSAQGTQLGFVFLAGPGPGRGPRPRIAIAAAVDGAEQPAPARIAAPAVDPRTAHRPVQPPPPG